MAIFTHWPNRVTALRFVGSMVLFTLLAVFGERPPETQRGLLSLLFWLFTITAFTDILDGYLARRDNLVSAFGRIADPFVDKILILGTLIFMAVFDWSRPWVPAWAVVIILAREFLVTAIRGYIERLGAEFPAEMFGKIKMVVQCVLVGDVIWIHAYEWNAAWLSFWQGLAWVLLAVTIFTTVGSGFTYILRARRILAEVSP
ncbi:MAG: CDP-alcohol phosphatidyltransferase family protein [Planctomycetota bacterium]|jgi:CDP-diacylglycerol--glycerol-3-phosphate 3-phosphatidyltransferase|nr:CDP-diacylglycerol--glycerol-3-phosphate 3-phosphatidyltransferase [Planctomycetota bacterium]MDP6520624.1 CDP-alcohol phosphatidyltransferase family protein [Planctomycetota bacterium]MDP6838334.1 CDP-alcohol phosphatidyltransferase family protein [Planctomycetota bacterium]MDP6954560.1 CDP-alcohol phosphatidyltransferase family protein [Planctomycetota bacterium]